MMILSDFEFFKENGNGKTIFANVTVTTETGILWWRKKQTEVRMITKSIFDGWHFVDTGKFCPGYQADNLYRSFLAKKSLEGIRHG